MALRASPSLILYIRGFKIQEAGRREERREKPGPPHPAGGAPTSRPMAHDRISRLKFPACRPPARLIAKTHENEPAQPWKPPPRSLNTGARTHYARRYSARCWHNRLLAKKGIMTWLETIQESVAPAYREFVDHLDGDFLVGQIVVLYAWSSVVERNDTNEVDVHLSDYVAIGNDSGDCELLMRRDGSASVYQCDAGQLGSDEPEWLHNDFSDWLAAGCPLPQGTERPFPLDGRIWLIRPPKDGLKGMFELRKILGQSWPASDMKDMMADVPSLLVEEGYPYATFRMLGNPDP